MEATMATVTYKEDCKTATEIEQNTVVFQDVTEDSVNQAQTRCCDNSYAIAREQSDLKMLDKIVSESSKRSSLPQNVLGRVSRREGMEVLPHLKRMKNSPQASVPLCLIENPAFRHLHNCFSHSKLPHLDEKYKQLIFPCSFTESLDLKPGSSEGGLKRRNSYPKARVATAENGYFNLRSVPENAQVPQSHSKGPLSGRSMSETAARSALSSASNGYLLPNKDFLSCCETERVDSRTQGHRKSGSVIRPPAHYDTATLRERATKVAEDTLQTINHSNCSVDETYAELASDRLRRVSSHVSSKSSLQSITE